MKKNVKDFIEYIKDFVKNYRVEIAIEAIIIAIILVFCGLGFVNAKNVLSDGTFIIGILSIPVFISQYISYKKNERREFYYSDLDKIIKFHTENNKRDENAIKIKVLQLENIFHTGISKAENKKDRVRLAEIVESVYFDLITQGINLKEDIRKINFKSIDNFEKDDIAWLKDGPLKIIYNKKEGNSWEKLSDEKRENEFKKWFKGNIEKVEPSLRWYGNGPLPKDQKGYSNLIFYKTEFNISSDSSALNYISTIFSSCTLVKVVFNFENENDKNTMVRNIKSINDEQDMVMIEAKAQCDGVITELSTAAPKIDVQVELGEEKDKSLVKDNKLAEIKGRYSKDDTFVKTSKRYIDDSRPYILKSWFSMTFQAFETFRKNKNNIKFIILNSNEDPNFAPYVVLDFDKDNFVSLVDYKQSNKSQLKRYDFYFWVTIDKKDGKISKVVDARDKDNEIKLNIRK